MMPLPGKDTQLRAFTRRRLESSAARACLAVNCCCSGVIATVMPAQNEPASVLNILRSLVFHNSASLAVYTVNLGISRFPNPLRYDQ